GRQLLVGDAWLGGDGDLVELAFLVEDALGGRQVEPGERRAADRDGLEVDDAREPKVLDRAERLDADLLPDLEALVVRRRLVDDDVAVAWPVAVDQDERVEATVAVGDAETEVGRAAVDDRLTVLPDDLGLAVDASL